MSTRLCSTAASLTMLGRPREKTSEASSQSIPLIIPVGTPKLCTCVICVCVCVCVGVCTCVICMCACVCNVCSVSACV